MDDGAIDWFSLEDGEYVALPADDAGVIRSKVFPSLWLATKALLAGDLVAVLATLQQGLRSQEHAGFMASLRSK